MQFVDKTLARRFESCEEMPQVLYARMFQQTRPDIGAAEEEICGGHMIFAGLGSPIGRATGVGLDREFTAGDLDRVEEFYRAHQAPSQVDLCPMHSPAVFELFKERGYGIAELNNVLYRKLDPQEKFPPPPAGCEIRRSLADGGRAGGSDRRERFLPRRRARGISGADRALLSDGGRVGVRRDCRRQTGRVRDGAGDSRAQGVCLVRSGNAGPVSRTRTADRAAPCTHVRSASRPDANTPWWSRRAERLRSATRSASAFAWPTARSR